MLLILGDGIRESVEQITEFMNSHAHLNFGFALVEYGVFRLQAEGDNSFFIQPRVVAETVEIERAVFRIENSQIVPVAPTKDKVEPTRKLTKVSEEIFYEQLKADSETKAGLEALLEDAKGDGPLYRAWQELDQGEKKADTTSIWGSSRPTVISSTTV